MGVALNTNLGMFGIGGMKPGKAKTSIYIDKELWKKYKASLAKKGLEIRAGPSKN